MISFIEGKLTEALPTRIVLEANGMGYEIFIPISTYEKLPGVGSPVRIYTHLTVREDAHILYGFYTVQERDLFRLLINAVTGIGPKLALNILSSFTPEAFREAVSRGDIKALAQVPGVGKKTAERIIVELRDKVFPAKKQEVLIPSVQPAARDQRWTDAIMALMALDFKQSEAHELVSRVVSKLGPNCTVEEIIRECLRQQR